MLTSLSSKPKKQKNQKTKTKSMTLSTLKATRDSKLKGDHQSTGCPTDLLQIPMIDSTTHTPKPTLSQSSTLTNLSLHDSTLVETRTSKSRACRKMDRLKNRILELEVLIQARDKSVPELEYHLKDVSIEIKSLKSFVLEWVSEPGVPKIESDSCIGPPLDCCLDIKTDIQEIKSILHTQMHHGLVGELLRKRVDSMPSTSFESMNNVELLQHVAEHWDKMIQKLSSDRDYQEEEKNILAQAYVDLEQQVNTLKQNIVDLERVIQNHEMTLCEKDRLILDLNEDLDEQQKHLDSANDDILQAAKLVADMEIKLNDKTKEIEILKQHHQQLLENMEKDKKSHLETVALLEKEKNTLKQQLDDKRRQDRQVTLEQLLNKTVQEHALVRRENTSLAIRLEEANTIITTQQNTIREAESHLYELRQQIMQQNQLVLSAQSANRAHEIQVERLEMDYGQVKLKLKAQQEYNERLEKALSHYTQQPSLARKSDAFEFLNPAWVPDANVTMCEYPECGEKFGLFKRRHHCRKCGHIFCFEHAKYVAKLNMSHLTYDDEGVAVRVCMDCFNNAELYHCPMDE